MKHLAVLLSVGVLLAVTTAKSQTRFLKYEGNPILDVGPPGSWDARYVEVDRVFLGDTSKLWYSGYDGSNQQIGYAWSTDGGFTWTKHPRPVLSPTPGRWDGQSAGYGYVILSASGYKMWYTGDDGATFRIGFATAINETLWVKRADPVLGPGPWSPAGVVASSVMEVAAGGFKMWYQGRQVFRFGYAEAVDETTWIPNSTSVFSDGTVYYQRVIFDEGLYRMWYTYHGGGGSGRRIKYATSSDGISWTIHPDNPVLSPGPASWETSVTMGDIHFDGRMYHLWYRGLSGQYWRSGYAVSPKGMATSVRPAGGKLDRNLDTVRVSARVDQPAGMSFYVEIESPNEVPADTLLLFDDGAHGDSLAGDGVFANSWIPGNRSSYWLDLKLRLQDSLVFEMDNIATFSPVVAVTDGSMPVPLEFGLQQNYPNPFNPTTTIEYALPHAGRLTLKVYNVLGEEVATLFDGEHAAGTFKATWDASHMPSGVYIYRLTAGEHVQARKMVLMK